MLQFIILRAKGAGELSEALSNVRSVALQSLPSWPNYMHLKYFEGKNAAILAFENTGTGGFQKRHFADSDGTVFAYDGLPYFDGLDPKNYLSSFRRHHMLIGGDEQRFHENTYGAWAKAWISENGAYVLNDFCGLVPLYTLQCDSFSAVSNRQLLLGAARDGAKIKLSRMNAAWLTGQASHMGTDMIVSGVRHVAPASPVRISFLKEKPQLGIGKFSLSVPQRDLMPELSNSDSDNLTGSLGSGPIDFRVGT